MFRYRLPYNDFSEFRKIDSNSTDGKSYFSFCRSNRRNNQFFYVDFCIIQIDFVRIPVNLSEIIFRI